MCLNSTGLHYETRPGLPTLRNSQSQTRKRELLQVRSAGMLLPLQASSTYQCQDGVKAFSLLP